MGRKELQTAAEYLLPAIAYGDAAGLPVETRSAAYIAEKYGTIDRLMASAENPFYKGHFEPGTWSDDTQLSMAVMKALVVAKGFDMRAIADAHVDAYGQTPQITRPDGQTVVRGWGGSTTEAVQRYMAGAPIEQCGTPDGSGNGIIMKMAPFALWHIALDTQAEIVYEECDRLTEFTHDSPVAKVATRVHFDILRYIAEHPYDAGEFADIAYSAAFDHERTLDEWRRVTSKTVEYLLDHMRPDTQTILEHTDGKGFHVPQTLAMAYGAFMAHEGAFVPSVYEAVNLGGDTDSTASIIAGMAAIRGIDDHDLPEDFERVQGLQELRAVSRSFAQLVKTARQSLD